MRVIITGGSGTLGQALMADLTADQHEVIILSRNPARVRDLPSHARAEKWDGRTAQGWGHLADGADAIVNLAGESIAGGDNVFAVLAGRWTPARKRAILQSRLDVGRAVVEAVQAAKAKPRVVVQASAVGYYGDRGDDELTEAEPAGKGFQAEVPVQWEKSTEPVEAMGVRRVVIRSAVVLGREGVLQLITLPYRLFVGGPLGSGRQWFPWIHEADEIGAIRFLIENDSARGVYNLAAPQAVRFGDFGRTLGRVIGRPHWLPTPAFALRLALGGVADGLLLGSQRQVPERLKQAGYRFKYPEVETALKELLQ